MGLLIPDAGEATILGVPFHDRAWRHSVGFLPENPQLYDYLTLREYLDYAGRLFGLAPGTRNERARDLAAELGLQRSLDVPLRRFSKGMTQRAALAQALMNDPAMVFLDEPMSGLDPLGRRRVRDLILSLKARGKTVFFSTHILSDAESLCDRVGILRSGRLAAVGRLDEILRVDVSHYEVLVSGLDEGRLALPVAAEERQRIGERLRLHVREGGIGALVAEVEAAGGRVLSVHPVQQSLEDYFVQETDRDERDPAWIPEE
jgi:ABC-2 type transport system ATP-binding protein